MLCSLHVLLYQEKPCITVQGAGFSALLSSEAQKPVCVCRSLLAGPPRALSCELLGGGAEGATEAQSRTRCFIGTHKTRQCEAVACTSACGVYALPGAVGGMKMLVQ